MLEQSFSFADLFFLLRTRCLALVECTFFNAFLIFFDESSDDFLFSFFIFARQFSTKRLHQASTRVIRFNLE